MTPLAQALVSCDADSVVNGTIAFLRSRQFEWGATWLCGNFMPFALASVSCAANSIINGTTAILSLRQLAVQLKCNMNFLVMWCHLCWHQCHMKPMVSSMTPLHSLDQWLSKWGATWPFGHWQHCYQWWCNMMLTVLSMVLSLGQDFSGHVPPLVLALALNDANIIINGILHSLGQDDWNDMQHNLFWSCDQIK